MDETLKTLAEEIMGKFGLKTIADVIGVLPKSMCHVIQEPKIFGTYQSQIVRLAFPKDEWEAHDARYREVRDEIIPKITTQDYFSSLLRDQPERLPCFCSQMADAAAVIVSRMYGEKVYVLRNIFVNYLHLPQRWHCITAMNWQSRIRYFDVSAYAQVLDRAKRRLVAPHQLPGFDAADIDLRFIVGDRWLQNEPFQREIVERDGALVDNFYPSPIPAVPPDEFFRIVS